MTETILCAAIYYPEYCELPSGYNLINIDKGLVLCGHRHYNIIGQCIGFKLRQADMGKYIQGFLTNTNRFVDRKEALLIAQNANQLKEGEHVFKELYSENLY